MTCFVIQSDGQRIQLPTLIAWEVNYALGSPCDSLSLRCPWSQDNTLSPALWATLELVYQGDTVFTGVVDECQISLSPQGSLLELSGRGLAARLLDNEALGQDYETATLADILADHVFPYGISLAQAASLPPVSHFSVAAGSSEWTVLDDFARYYGGVLPRFDRLGRLLLTPLEQKDPVAIDDATPLTALSCTFQRYGRLSEVWVRDRYQNLVERLRDEDFAALGGQARRVITMPGISSYKSMRYSGAFQLRQSAAQALRLEAVTPVPFFAMPGDSVAVQRSNWRHNGRYTVLETQVSAGQDGVESRLTLGQADYLT